MPLTDLFPGIPHIESPLFNAIIDELGLSAAERRIAVDLHQRGFAVIDFPDPEIDARVERIKRNLAPRFDADLDDPTSIKNSGLVQRVQDAWAYDDDVRAIATNETLLQLLRKLYGRNAFPFQTLNFPVGTQQHLHSDSIHFSSIPERFMCGVWLAMEDVSADAGPLTYIPGSHAWRVIKNHEIGRAGWGSHLNSAQEPFEQVWEAIVANGDHEAELFTPRKGQALIWAANLLHGGSVQEDPRLTRWSQVTHYYFDDCLYYTPAFSDEPLGRLDLRRITDIRTGEIRENRFMGEVVPHPEDNAPERVSGLKSLRRKLGMAPQRKLPADFDPELYLQINPDVRAAGINPADHFLVNGVRERRRYRP